MTNCNHLDKNIKFENTEIIEKIKEIVQEKQLTYNIVTYGCAMNEHDSEHISGILEQMGFVPGEDTSADLVLFNTCCVRDTAENKVFGNVGALKKQKKANPNKIICVCGCMMQQKEYAADLRKHFPFVDVAFGTHNIQNLPDLIWSALNKQKVIEVFDVDGYIVENLPVKRTNEYSAYINIMYGCNNFCTYCIVPYVRGRERSRASENIIAEAKKLASEGVTEITLLGQNVNSYNNDSDDLSFPELLEELAHIEGFKRIKYLTSHPKDLSDELIDVIARNKNISRSLHLPVQAGSNNVLKTMNRKYTREHYLGLIEKIKAKVPDIGLSTDMIVGFPGETEEEFQETLDLLRKVKYDSVFSFMYNIRKGTAAEKMTNHIDPEVKKDRLSRLIDVQNEISLEIGKECIGKVYEVLVEKYAKKDGQVCGRSHCGKLINFNGNADMIGKYFNVKITNAHSNSLSGEIVEL